MMSGLYTRQNSSSIFETRNTMRQEKQTHVRRDALAGSANTACIIGLLAGVMCTTVTQAAQNDGMQRLVERGRGLRHMIVCADLKRTGEAGPRDAKDLAVVQEGAQANAPACLILLGRWSERGEGVPKDAAQAKAFYERAAALDPKGHVELGRMAEQGIAGPVAYAEAWEHYSQAAAKEDAGGLLGLGRMAERGLGRTANDRDAVDYYCRAARRWDDQAWGQLDRIQSARPVMSAQEADLERRRWRSLLGSRAGAAYEAANAMSAFKNYPYEVTLRFAFKRGEATPAWVRVTSPSANPAFDLALQQAMTTLRMPPAPIFGPNAQFEIDLPLHFSGEPAPAPAPPKK
jgi:hypothetical protein